MWKGRHVTAHFVNCTRCGRLITLDSLNPGGRCTAECGGSGRHPRPALVAGCRQILEQHGPALTALGKAHRCPWLETGNPEDCAFGGEGCR